MNFTELTIAAALRGIAEKQFSRDELIAASQARIAEMEPQIKAFITQEQITPTNDGVLSSIPCSIKDVIVTKGVKTTAGSRMLESYIPTYDATVVAKLKDAGAVIMGKSNCDEFAQGASTEYSAFFPSHNPHDITRVPGGTSGGSAASVASGEVLFGIGSDTGGSVRQPAALCGCVGYKPTYGRISRYGLIAAASSLDTIGIHAKTAEDVKIVLRVIEGRDPFDATCREFPICNSQFPIQGNPEKPLQGLRIGVIREYVDHPGLDPRVKERVMVSIGQMCSLGAQVIDVSIPMFAYALACYYVINPCEIASNLARFDGVRYGKGITPYTEARSALFGDEVKRRIMLGTFALSAGYADAYYKNALAVRARIRREFREAFVQCDVLVTPTAPSVAFRFGEKANDPLAMYLEDIFTVPVNLTGVPAVSVPCGMVADEGVQLPVGLQLIGDRGADYEILDIAEVFQRSGSG